MRIVLKPQSGIRNRNSFTLIELLVVVAIIAVLISILLPALSQARKSARALVCATREKSIGQALQAFANDNGDYFPMAAETWPSAASKLTWIHRLSPYLSVPVSGYWRFATTDLANNPDPDAWTCPELVKDGQGSYRCNSTPWSTDGVNYKWLMKFNVPGTYDTPQHTQIPQTRIENPSSILLVLEKMSKYQAYSDSDYYPEVYGDTRSRTSTQTQSGGRAIGIYNHWGTGGANTGGTNILYVDGHVDRWKGEKLLFTMLNIPYARNVWYPYNP